MFSYPRREAFVDGYLRYLDRLMFSNVWKMWFSSRVTPRWRWLHFPLFHHYPALTSSQHVTTAAWRLLQLLLLLLQWRHGVSLLLHEPASEVESQLLAAGQQRIAIPIWMLHQCHTYYILWHSQYFLITIDISFWYNHLQMSSDRIFDPQTGLTFPELPSPLTYPWISLASAKSSSAWWKSLWIPPYISQMWM